MNEAAWLSAEKRQLTNLILKSHEAEFGRSLITCQEINDSHRLKSQELFYIQMPVMAHDASPDPLLIYTNSAALSLWKRSWKEMIGMPSRRTTPEDQIQARGKALQAARSSNAIKGYQGIRIDSKGRRFYINNVRLWTIWSERDHALGQAAAFDSWSYL